MEHVFFIVVAISVFPFFFTLNKHRLATSILSIHGECLKVF